MANSLAPMPCAAADSHDIPYVAAVLEWVRSQPSTFDATRVYSVGFSQNAMFALYAGACFEGSIAGMLQAGSGLSFTGQRPFPLQMEGQCRRSDYLRLGENCRADAPCRSCEFWPLWPCWSSHAPFVDCVLMYTDDFMEGTDAFAVDALQDEGHDARWLRFSPHAQAPSGHEWPPNYLDWVVGCLAISAPCSAACQASFQSCVTSANGVFGTQPSPSAYAACARTEMLRTLPGCVAGCAPTSQMLNRSQTPSLQRGRFGQPPLSAAVARPATSLCVSPGLPAAYAPSPPIPLPSPPPPPHSDGEVRMTIRLGGRVAIELGHALHLGARAAP